MNLLQKAKSFVKEWQSFIAIICMAAGGVAWEVNTRADAKQVAIDARAQAVVVAAEFKEFKDDSKAHFEKLDTAVANSASALQVLTALYQRDADHQTFVNPVPDNPMKPKVITDEY